MTFINEYASQDDIDKFKLDELLNKYLNAALLYKHHWLVDKDTNSWLLPIKRLNNSESLWIFHYKDTNIEIKLYKAEDGWDLTSIAPNSLNNQEIIYSLRIALEVLGLNEVVYAAPKKTSPKEDKKETQVDVKQKSKRKISYLDIVTAIIILGILFFIANDTNNKINPTITDDDNNRSFINNNTDDNISAASTKLKTTEPKYNICATRHDGVFLTSSEDLNSGIKILNSNYDQCNIDKYGNLYMISNSNEALYKANLDGTNIRKILSLPSIPSGLAIDNEGERIFTAQWSQQIKASEIVYSDLSGNNKTILISNRKFLRSVSGMFYDHRNDKLYFSDGTGKKISAIDLKTKKVKKILSSSHPVGVVPDYKNNRIIWLDRFDKNIYSANFDGSDKKILIDYNPAEKSVLHSVDYALTIDAKNDRLIFGYPAKKIGFIIETANLDGTQRVKAISKNTTFNSFTSFNSSFIESLFSKKSSVNTQDILSISPELKRCFSCHGKDWSKSALNKSQIVSNMSKENIAMALIGYKNGTYGRSMKGLMKAEVLKYSDIELEAMAETIKSKGK